MRVSRQAIMLAVVVVVAAVAFGAGYLVGGAGSKGYRIYTGDCYVGAKGATCNADGLSWGASNQVSWTDASNVGRGGVNDPIEWPTCLPPLQEVKGVRFAGALLPVGDGATVATIVWVDCRH